MKHLRHRSFITLRTNYGRERYRVLGFRSDGSYIIQNVLFDKGSSYGQLLLTDSTLKQFTFLSSGFQATLAE